MSLDESVILVLSCVWIALVTPLRCPNSEEVTSETTTLPAALDANALEEVKLVDTSSEVAPVRLTTIPPLLPISRPPLFSILTFNWLPIFSRAIPAVTCPALENCVNAKSCVPTVASVSLVQTNPILSLVVPC